MLYQEVNYFLPKLSFEFIVFIAKLLQDINSFPPERLIPLAFWSCITNESLGDDLYLFFVFVAVDHPLPEPIVLTDIRQRVEKVFHDVFWVLGVREPSAF